MTVLFCDLVGFTPLSEQLDPEFVRELQALYFGRMGAEIALHGGIIDKYSGDAVLAVFGAPVAQEDDADRCVHCAIGMQIGMREVTAAARERWGVEVAMRVGINTGEVVTGVWEAGGRRDLSVTGDVVNSAARLQTSAEPGGIIVGSETMRLAQRSVRFGDAMPLSLKGRAEPFIAYPVIGLRERVAERWEARGEQTPFVGRERELRALVSAWEHAQQGEGQLVTLIAEAGVGKSRLLQEAGRQFTQTGDARIVRGRCVSYGSDVGLGLIADLAKNLFRLSEDDPAEQTAGKIDGLIEHLLPAETAAARTEVRDVLGGLVGLPSTGAAPDDARARHQILTGGLRALLTALSQEGTVLLVLEDLHWIDQASVEVLSAVLSSIHRLPILAIITQRPGVGGKQPPWHEWSWPERIALRPLDDREAIALAGAVLRGIQPSSELERYVTDRTGGNPFFVEEMLLALQETGGLVERGGRMYLAEGAAERLPATLTEILLARLDRLEGQVRTLAQVASVIGRSFAVRLLAQVVGRESAALEMPLSALQRAEIAFPRPSIDPEFIFKHATIRDVAYNTLLQRRRQELHAAVARSLADLYPVDEYVETIAFHFARSDEHAEAAVWLERAGDRAASLYANVASIQHYREAKERLERTGAAPAAIARVNEKMGAVLQAAGRLDEAIEAVEAAAATYQRLGDLEAEGRAVARLGIIHFFRGSHEEGVERVEPVLQRLERKGPSRSLALLYASFPRVLGPAGRVEDGLEIAEKGVVLASSLGDERLMPDAIFVKGRMVFEAGHLEEAIPFLEDAARLAQKADDLFVLTAASAFAAGVHLDLGHLGAAVDHALRSLDAAERRGGLEQMGGQFGSAAVAFLHMGEWDAVPALEERRERVSGGSRRALLAVLLAVAVHRGQWDEAARLEERIARDWDTFGPEVAGTVEAIRAEADLLHGRIDDAVVRLEELRAASCPSDHIEIYGCVLVRALLERGDVAGAEAVARETAALEFPVARPAILLMQATVLAAQGRHTQAVEALEQAIALAETFPAPFVAARAELQWGLLEAERVRTEEARPHLERALAVFTRLRACPHQEQAEQALVRLTTAESLS